MGLDSASIFHGLEPGLHAGPYLKGTIGTTSNLVRQLKGLEVGLDSRSSVSLGRVQPGLRGLEVWFPRRPFRSSSSRQHLFPSQLSCYASSLCPPLHMEASNAIRAQPLNMRDGHAGKLVLVADDGGTGVTHPARQFARSAEVV
jgi:hypothetical protein